MLSKLFSLGRAEPFKSYDRIDSISDVVDLCFDAYASRPAIVHDTGAGYEKIHFGEYAHAVKAMVRFLQARPGSGKVLGTFCKNRFEWDVYAHASFYTANRLFPIDTKINDVEMLHILGISQLDTVLVSMGQYARLKDVCDQAGQSPLFVIADLLVTFEDQGVDPRAFRQQHPELLYVSQVVEQYGNGPAVSPNPLLSEPDVVLGLYPTSGTTSLPKVVQITQRNIVHQVNESVDVLNLRPNEAILNIGPYTHIATLVEFLLTKTRGFTVIYFTREPDEDGVLENEIKRLKNAGFRIKALMAVPKFWIYVLKEVLEEMRVKPVMNTVYNHLTQIELKGDTYDLGTLDKAKLTAASILLRNKLGGYFSYGVSSSMKLDPAIIEIFGKLGVTIMDIYGATECSGVISRNKLNDIVLGSTGRIIDGLAFRLEGLHSIPGLPRPAGNLLLKGPTISAGYLGMELPLSDDGYYDTGDVAYVDEQRSLYIVGRKKELLRWHDGSYVDPQKMSNLMVRSLYIKDAMVIHAAPEDDCLTAYLYPDYARIEKDPDYISARQQGIAQATVLRQLFGRAIDFANATSGITATISRTRIYLLPRKLERTPTHKIKFIFELQRLHESTAL